MRHPIALFAVLFLLAGFAQAADPRCPPIRPPTAGLKDFQFDLATGVPAGEVTYELKDRVRFVFTNRNPFLQYDIKIDTQEQPEPALTAFTSLFSILSLLPSATGTAPTTTAQTAAAAVAREARGLAARAVNPCDQSLGRAKSLLDSALTDLAGLQQQTGTLQSKINTIKSKLLESQTIFESQAATCDTLQATGDRLEQSFTTADLSAALGAYQTAHDKLLAPVDPSGTTRIDQIDDSLATAREECRRDPDALETITRLRFIKNNIFGSSQLQELTKQRQLLQTTVGEISAKRAEIRGILNNPDNFITYRFAGPVENRSKTTVTIKVKKPAEAQFPTNPTYTFAVNFGGPSRFSLSVGIGNSWLQTREYEAIQGIPLDASGNPEANAAVTRVIGFKEDSNHRITPMLLLNTRLTKAETFLQRVHFSLGLSGKVDNKGTDVEYLAGFSWNVDRFLVTLGAYNGRVQELQEGFHLGSKLPTEVAQVPVRKDREWGPVIAITYRVR